MSNRSKRLWGLLPNDGLTRLFQALASGAIVCVLILTSVNMVQVKAAPAAPSYADNYSHASPDFSTPPCPFALSPTDVLASVTGFGAATTNATNYSVADNISAFYKALCSNTSVSAAVSLHGVGNATLGLYGTRANGIELPNLTVNWDFANGTSPHCANQSVEEANQIYWSLNLSSGTITGPHSWSGPPPEYTVVCGTSGQSWSTDNWAGYEFWDPGLAVVGDYAFTKPGGMSADPSAQSRPYNVGVVDSAASAWVGIENTLGAVNGGDLLQTGYAYDASSPSSGWCVGFTHSCDYGLWYEDFPHSAYPYSGHPLVSAGDILEEVVNRQSAGIYLLETYDVMTGQTYSTTLNMGSSWTASYATDILEALVYSTGGGPVQGQIPDFSGSPVHFEGGGICVASTLGCGYTPYQAYSAGTYRDDVMSQSPGVSNTQEQMIYGNSYWSQLEWYPEVQWLSSAYSWCYLSANQGNSGSIYCPSHSFGGNGGGGGCVMIGTKVLTPSGYVAIQNLSPGSSIEEYNTSSRSLVAGTLRWANTTTVGSILQINNGWLNVTPREQPIFIKNATTGYEGWLADPWNLTTSDSIWNAVSGTWIPVTCVKLLPLNTTVYDVITSGLHSFIVLGATMFMKSSGNGSV